MPRKPCDNVNEFRITLGDFERKKIQEIITTQQANVAVDGVTAIAQAAGSAISGIGIYALGAAALLYVGFSIDDFIDNTSTRLANWLNKSGFVNYHADEYGRELVKVYAELQSLSDEAISLDPSNPADLKRHEQIMKRVALLVKRQDVLEALINAIADGEVDGWNAYGGKGADSSIHGNTLDAAYTDWYTRTHGHPPDEVPVWDIVTEYVPPDEDGTPSEKSQAEKDMEARQKKEETSVWDLTF